MQHHLKGLIFNNTVLTDVVPSIIHLLSKMTSYWAHVHDTVVYHEHKGTYYKHDK